MQSTNKYHEFARHKDRKLGFGHGVKAWKTDAYILKRFDAFSVHELAYKGNIGSENLGLEFFKSSKVSGSHFENSKSSVSHLKKLKKSRAHKKNDRLAVSQSLAFTIRHP